MTTARAGAGPSKSEIKFAQMARSRGIEFAHLGMRVRVGGKAGTIVGCNQSANLEVWFHETGNVVNCHPHWDIIYYNDDDEIVGQWGSTGAGLGEGKHE